LIVAMMTFGVGVVLAALFLAGNSKFSPWAEPLPSALGYALAIFLLASLVFRCRHGTDARKIGTTVLAIASFMLLISTGIMTNIRVRRAEDQASSVARLKEFLPEGHRLVSFGQIDSVFAFYYGQPIPALPFPPAARDVPGEETCFCFNAYN